MKTNYISHTPILLFAIFVLVVPSFAKSPKIDLLLYFDREREPWGITAYNPQNSEKLYLPVTSEVSSVKTSGDGRIAYIQENDVWVLDVLESPNNPIRITHTPDEQERLISWTPNGDLLQFEVSSRGGQSLHFHYDGNEVLAAAYGDRLERYWNENGWYAAFDEETSSWYVWNGQEKIYLEFLLLAGEVLWENFQ